MSVPTPRPTSGHPLCKPAQVYLHRDATDLARACYGLTLDEVCRRLHSEKRAAIAHLLITRGWHAADVSRTMGYSHSAALYHALKGVSV